MEKSGKGQKKLVEITIEEKHHYNDYPRVFNDARTMLQKTLMK